MVEYSKIEVLLHRFALGARPALEMSFDIEQSRFKDAVPKSAGDHVFICGLARAGTTILMRQLYDTDAFCSLTYRDMPFVLAPNTWSRLSKRGQVDIAKKERAHKDGIQVDVDSPEALDEVFWRAFAGDEFIDSDRLIPMAADAELIAKYRAYVGTILLRYGKTRYLSKGNNNILRLSAITKAFPNATVLVPFRDPVTQSLSLMGQHNLMLQTNADDPFSARYMAWLAHHEFGKHHRPFVFDGQNPSGQPDNLSYWLELWCNTYAFIQNSIADAPKTFLPVCYEDLCSNPKVFEHICKKVSVTKTIATEFKLASRDHPNEVSALDLGLLARANAIYDSLRKMSGFVA